MESYYFTWFFWLLCFSVSPHSFLRKQCICPWLFQTSALVVMSANPNVPMAQFRIAILFTWLTPLSVQSALVITMRLSVFRFARSIAFTETLLILNHRMSYLQNFTYSILLLDWRFIQPSWSTASRFKAQLFRHTFHQHSSGAKTAHKMSAQACGKATARQFATTFPQLLRLKNFLSAISKKFG